MSESMNHMSFGASLYNNHTLSQVNSGSSYSKST